MFLWIVEICENVRDNDDFDVYTYYVAAQQRQEAIKIASQKHIDNIQFLGDRKLIIIDNNVCKITEVTGSDFSTYQVILKELNELKLITSQGTRVPPPK